MKNTLTMAAAAARAGHVVTVTVPDLSARSPFPIDPRIRVRVIRTPRSLPAGIRKTLYYGILAIVAARGADVCVVPYSLLAYAAWISSRLARGCRVAYVIGAYEPETHGRLAESGRIGRALRTQLASWSYRLPLERVYASRYLARRVGEPGAATLHLGIDHAVFHASGRTLGATIRVGVVARRGPVKGYADFLRAWGRVTHGNVALTVVNVDGLPTPAGASVLGPLGPAEMAEFYRGIDVFAFTSLEEGFPAPPLEAMACGCAVVSTRCGGVEEYASDGVNALLVPVGDPAALALAIERVAVDADLRARLAAGGRSTAAAWTEERTAEAVARLIEAPLSGDR